MSDADGRRLRSRDSGRSWWPAMRRWLRDSVRKNLSLKILAFALAVVAWLLVQGRPTAEQYATIRLEYIWPDELVLAGEPVSQVLVKAVGPRSQLREMERRDLRYTIDLSENAPGETTLNLMGVPVTDFPAGLEITTISPSSLTFRFDERITRALPVKVPTQGEVAYGFEVKEIVVEPEVVTLSGAKPDLEKLVEIKTKPLEMSGRDRDFAEILQLDLGKLRARPEHEPEVTVNVHLSQIIEEREMVVEVRVPATMEGVGVEPAEATVMLHGPARELHKLMASNLELHVEEGEVAYSRGRATIEYSGSAQGDGSARVVLRRVALPESVEVTGVRPTSFTLVRGARR